MSFGLPPIKHKPSIDDQFDVSDGIYGISNPMVSGLSGTRANVNYSHPLEASEKNFQRNKNRMEMIMLRNTQGLHAPLRLAMELKAANKIGRHPFLPSSGVMRDVLLGRDEEIGFEDILNTAEFREQMGQPHAVMEKNLGIL